MTFVDVCVIVLAVAVWILTLAIAQLRDRVERLEERTRPRPRFEPTLAQELDGYTRKRSGAS